MSNLGNVKCCPQCNYIVAAMEIDLAIVDFRCPNCNFAHISNFYSLGSKVHLDIITGITKQMSSVYKVIHPLPFPKCDTQEAL